MEVELILKVSIDRMKTRGETNTPRTSFFLDNSGNCLTFKAF